MEDPFVEMLPFRRSSVFPFRASKRFIDTLNLTDEQIIFPNSQLIVAIGAAIAAEDEDCVKFSTIISNLKNLTDVTNETNRLMPLLLLKKEYKGFRKDMIKIQCQSGIYKPSKETVI